MKKILAYGISFKLAEHKNTYDQRTHHQTLVEGDDEKQI
jgi:hypothetical protein